MRDYERRMAEAEGACDAPSGPILDLDERGDLIIWEVNRAAVNLWRLLSDQWIRAGMDGSIVAFDMRVALEYAREFAKVDGSVMVLPLVADLKFIAEIVMGLAQKRRSS